MKGIAGKNLQLFSLSFILAGLLTLIGAVQWYAIKIVWSIVYLVGLCSVLTHLTDSVTHSVTPSTTPDPRDGRRRHLLSHPLLGRCCVMLFFFPLLGVVGESSILYCDHARLFALLLFFLFLPGAVKVALCYFLPSFYTPEWFSAPLFSHISKALTRRNAWIVEMLHWFLEH